MSTRHSLAVRLFNGDISYDFIGRRRIWYVISAALIVLSLGSLLVRGVHPSIDFKGGALFELPCNGGSVSEARAALTAAGVSDAVVQKTTSRDRCLRLQTPPLDEAAIGKVKTELVQRLDVPAGSISVNTVGASWGSQITRKAVLGLVVFLIVVIAYLSVRFEFKMALAAIAALLHDLIITAGIYSLSGFEVSPSTVIALLTILGYSLYDTVVVFDKVRENTAGLTGGSRMTFSQATNLAVNQTLIRSINTTIIALLPVAGLLIIGAGLLGAGSLKDLALALFIGLAAGAYSSIFLAPPLLCDLKEREPANQQLARRVAARISREAAPTAAPAPAPASAGRARTGGAGGSATLLVDDGPGQGGGGSATGAASGATPVSRRSGRPNRPTDQPGEQPDVEGASGTAADRLDGDSLPPGSPPPGSPPPGRSAPGSRSGARSQPRPSSKRRKGGSRSGGRPGGRKRK